MPSCNYRQGKTGMNNLSTKPAAKSPLRRWQFSLKSLLIVVTISAGVLAFFDHNGLLYMGLFVGIALACVTVGIGLAFIGSLTIRASEWLDQRKQKLASTLVDSLGAFFYLAAMGMILVAGITTLVAFAFISLRFGALAGLRGV